MDKDKFLFLLANSASLTEEETKELTKLQDEFPYSQAIHNLVARGAQLNQFADKQSLLTTAAVYATDRAVLKAIVTALPGTRKVQPEIKKREEVIKASENANFSTDKKPSESSQHAPVIEKAPIQNALKSEQPKVSTSTEIITAKVEVEKKVPTLAFEGSKLGGDELIDELYHDLDKLKKLKHDFEVAVEQFDKVPMAELKTLSPNVKEKKEEAPEKKKPKKGKLTEGIIAEIKSSKKKIKPSDPKQKEQLDIINQFIKSEPSIGKNMGSDPSPDAKDLTESSSIFTDNIVSETLVEILIKQGKKDKAVEVLRKLIWKFPQKKAYFAAQIEELTS